MISIPIVITEFIVILIVISVFGYIRLRARKRHHGLIDELIAHVQNIGDAKYSAIPKQSPNLDNVSASGLTPAGLSTVACPNCGITLQISAIAEGNCSVCDFKFEES